MSDITLYVMNPFVTSFLIYWSLSFSFYLYDKYGDLNKRIDPNINWSLYKKTVYHVLYLQFCYSLPVLYMLIPFWKWRGITTTYNTIGVFDLIKLGLNGLLGETIFFYLHYWSHLILYSSIHKMHHEWTNPCAVSAAYAHPIEYVVVSLPSFLLPPMITGSNWIISNVWFMIATTSVVLDHCGYKNIHTSEFHWKHHKYFNVNYGTNTIGDVVSMFYKKFIR